ncbi:MAG: helix-turn-helix transcriptional regulator [Polyangiaceae bacterium]|nr:helix-turn-helix transcriptional regulator [Polyangiaceae bacterium]
MTSSEFGCPVEFALSVLGGKWKTVLLAHLKTGPKRYRDLRNLVPKLSDKMLTQRIHELELGGLIEKDAASAYVMTDRGRSLSPVLQALFDWGEEHRDNLTNRP